VYPSCDAFGACQCPYGYELTEDGDHCTYSEENDPERNSDLSKILHMNNKNVLLISPCLHNLQFPAMWIEIVMSTPPAIGLAKSSDTFAPASRVSEAMDTTASQSATTPVKLLVA